MLKMAVFFIGSDILFFVDKLNDTTDYSFHKGLSFSQYLS